jgi:hypothetical protein
MTPAELLALIDARAAEDGEFAALVAARRDRDIAEALSVGRIRYQSRLITERGVISALGPVEGEALLAGLESFANSSLAPEHPLYAAHPGIKRVIGWLKAPAEGVDIGDPLTHQLLDAMAALGTSGVTAGRVAAIKALAAVPDPISVDAVSDALNERG